MKLTAAVCKLNILLAEALLRIKRRRRMRWLSLAQLLKKHFSYTISKWQRRLWAIYSQQNFQFTEFFKRSPIHCTQKAYTILTWSFNILNCLLFCLRIICERGKNYYQGRAYSKRQRPFVPGKIRCFLNKTKTDRYKRHISTEIIHDLAKTRLI